MSLAALAAAGGVPPRVRQLQAHLATLAPRTPGTALTPQAGPAFAAALEQASGAGAAGDDAGGLSGDRVVTEARRYLGVPYRWGGTDPATGLDCSGFTQLVYRDLGVSLPRTSQEQARVGTPVASLAEARPGDLIVLDGGGHVGIYVGDGKMIHSPHTGDVVKISPVWNGVTAIRRLTPAAPAAAPATGGGDRVRPGVPYAELFNAAGARHGVSPTLLAAMAKTESGFNPRAASPAGAQGLMQFMPGTARSYGIDPWDPAQAVDGAARYLADSLNRFGGSVEKAVAAYNAGPGAVQRHGGVPPYRETQNYVRLVLQRRGEMR